VGKTKTRHESDRVLFENKENIKSRVSQYKINQKETINAMPSQAEP
jgi:hypothetical protein